MAVQSGLWIPYKFHLYLINLSVISHMQPGHGCNFSYDSWRTGVWLSFFISVSFSLTLPPFSCLLFSFLFELVLSSSMCQCAVTFSRRALVFGAVKRTCVAWAAQTRCPHTLWPGQTLDIWYVLLALCQACILFSCALTHCALHSLCYPFFIWEHCLCDQGIN